MSRSHPRRAGSIPAGSAAGVGGPGIFPGIFRAVWPSAMACWSKWSAKRPSMWARASCFSASASTPLARCLAASHPRARAPYSSASRISAGSTAGSVGGWWSGSGALARTLATSRTRSARVCRDSAPPGAGWMRAYPRIVWTAARRVWTAVSAVIHIGSGGASGGGTVGKAPTSGNPPAGCGGGPGARAWSLRWRARLSASARVLSGIFRPWMAQLCMASRTPAAPRMSSRIRAVAFGPGSATGAARPAAWAGPAYCTRRSAIDSAAAAISRRGGVSRRRLAARSRSHAAAVTRSAPTTAGSWSPIMPTMGPRLYWRRRQARVRMAWAATLFPALVATSALRWARLAASARSSAISVLDLGTAVAAGAGGFRLYPTATAASRPAASSKPAAVEVFPASRALSPCSWSVVDPRRRAAWTWSRSKFAGRGGRIVARLVARSRRFWTASLSASVLVPAFSNRSATAPSSTAAFNMSASRVGWALAMAGGALAGPGAIPGSCGSSAQARLSMVADASLTACPLFLASWYRLSSAPVRRKSAARRRWSAVVVGSINPGRAGGASGAISCARLHRHRARTGLPSFSAALLRSSRSSRVRVTGVVVRGVSIVLSSGPGAGGSGLGGGLFGGGRRGWRAGGQFCRCRAADAQDQFGDQVVFLEDVGSVGPRAHPLEFGDVVVGGLLGHGPEYVGRVVNRQGPRLAKPAVAGPVQFEVRSAVFDRCNHG